MLRLVVFDYFRAVAILTIIAGHCLHHPWITSFSDRVLANLIQGGTPLFVFISGFFFHHVFYTRFQYLAFLRKKSKNVLMPYLVFSGLGLLYFALSNTPLPDAEMIGVAQPERSKDWLQVISAYLWTGRTSFAYWYMPFILLMFLLSPLFIVYIRLPMIARVILLLIFFVIALFVHRPAANLSPWHAVLYFTPIYLLGIMVSMHRDKVDGFVRDKAWIFAVIAVFFAVLQALTKDGFGNYHKAGLWGYNGIDLLLLQKTALCFFWLSLLQKLTDRHQNVVILTYLAAASFALFFIHPWILMGLVNRDTAPLLLILPWPITFLLLLAITVLLSLVIALGIKWLAGRYSRLISGW